MSAGEFDVFQHIKLAGPECVARGVDGKTAVDTAHSHCSRPAAVLGIIEKVQIMDGAGYCCFEWQFGKGVTFPPANEGWRPKP